MPSDRAIGKRDGHEPTGPERQIGAGRIECRACRCRRPKLDRPVREKRKERRSQTRLPIGRRISGLWRRSGRLFRRGLRNGRRHGSGRLLSSSGCGAQQTEHQPATWPSASDQVAECAPRLRGFRRRLPRGRGGQHVPRGAWADSSGHGSLSDRVLVGAQGTGPRYGATGTLHLVIIACLNEADSRSNFNPGCSRIRGPVPTGRYPTRDAASDHRRPGFRLAVHAAHRAPPARAVGLFRDPAVQHAGRDSRAASRPASFSRAGRAASPRRARRARPGVFEAGVPAARHLLRHAADDRRPGRHGGARAASRVRARRW